MQEKIIGLVFWLVFHLTIVQQLFEKLVFVIIKLWKTIKKFGLGENYMAGAGIRLPGKDGLRYLSG